MLNLFWKINWELLFLKLTFKEHVITAYVGQVSKRNKLMSYNIFSIEKWEYL